MNVRRTHWVICILPVLLGAYLPVRGQSIDSTTFQKFQSPAAWDALSTELASDPANKDSVREMESAIESGLPDFWKMTWTAHLALDSTTLPDGLGYQLTPKAYLPNHVAEPQHGSVFPRMTYIYVPTQTPETNQLLCRLHYMQDSDAALASRMGALLTLLHRTLVQQTGREPDGDTTPFDVWLCRQGQAGGDEWHRNIYFYDLDTSRSSIEWIREIAHEYGHMALPPIGGYREPEFWANGYYGERLMVRWLARIPNGPALVEQVWGDFSGWPNFDRLLIAPAIALYKKNGPDETLAAQTDEEGMRYLIGQMLVFDDKYGAKRLADVFQFLPHAREALGPDFGTAITMELSQQARRGL